MNPKPIHTVRWMYPWEIQQARRVFADQLKYDSIRIHENAGLPIKVDIVGKWLMRKPYVYAPNAITLGNHCYFPVKLPEAPVPLHQPDHHMIGWLIHELTHAWQYQRLGWRYLVMAIRVLLRQGTGAYEYGGEAGLVESRNIGRKLVNFNLEQQANLARNYYEALVNRKDTSAWKPYISELQKIPV